MSPAPLLLVLPPFPPPPLPPGPRVLGGRYCRAELRKGWAVFFFCLSPSVLFMQARKLLSSQLVSLPLWRMGKRKEGKGSSPKCTAKQKKNYMSRGGLGRG